MSLAYASAPLAPGAVEELHEHHEVPFEPAFVLDRLSIERLEAGHVRPATERDASHQLPRLAVVQGNNTPRCWGQSTI